jgi:hypothetical protein
VQNPIDGFGQQAFALDALHSGLVLAVHQLTCL